VVSSDPGHEIAWIAKDGEAAVRACQQDTPDVVLMDLIMPVMDGAEATRRIMEQSPCPVLVVTSTVAGNYSLVCEALGCGAYDAVCTPELGDRRPEEAGAEVLSKLATVHKIQRRLKSASRPVEPVAPAAPPAQGPGRTPAGLVAIGASAGGPQALNAILSQWPCDATFAVIIVQHIGKEFVDALIHWLSDHSRLPVRLAAQGDRPTAGSVLVADADDHLVITRNRTLDYVSEPRDMPYRPSVDVFFDSLAAHWPWPSVAVLLTGIGRDGADGLLKLRRAGWHTVAQDESSSVVFGMPQAAREIGAAVQVLPINRIASEVANRVAN
jgi:two-component system response regulator WspF